MARGDLSNKEWAIIGVLLPADAAARPFLEDAYGFDDITIQTTPLEERRPAAKVRCQRGGSHGRIELLSPVVSINRQRWIETLRDLIASFCTEMVAAAPIRRQIVTERSIIPSLDSDLLGRVEEVTRTMMRYG